MTINTSTLSGNYARDCHGLASLDQAASGFVRKVLILRGLFERLRFRQENISFSAECICLALLVLPRRHATERAWGRSAGLWDFSSPYQESTATNERRVTLRAKNRDLGEAQIVRFLSVNRV